MVKAMAKKKKQEEASGGAPEWMATFADLMNLLLCFFVLLFAMSSVDESKFSQLADSLSSAFNIFKDSGTSIFVDGDLINLGTAQLNDLGELIMNMGQTSEETGDEIKKLADAIESGELDAKEVSRELNKELTERMYNEVSEYIENSNLDGYLTYNIDENGSRFVDINIDGSICFDTGSAVLKEEYLPVLSKIGDILNQFNEHMIDIIGHTDSVPISTAKYPSNMELSTARSISVANYLADYKGMDRAMMRWAGRADYDFVDTNSTAEGRARNRRIEIRIYNQVNSY